MGGDPDTERRDRKEGKQKKGAAEGLPTPRHLGPSQMGVFLVIWGSLRDGA